MRAFLLLIALLILVAIGLTACYVLRANRAFDRRVDAILQRS